MHHGVAVELADTNGYVLAFRIGAGLLVVGGALVAILLEHVRIESMPQLAALPAEAVPEGPAA